MLEPRAFDNYTLLAVTAHPDDETILCGGLLAWCAYLGATVNLLCLTRGEHGQGGSDVANQRSAELTAAASVLGITSTTLLRYEDGMLAWTDNTVIEHEIRATINRQQPDVVVTFDHDGAYGHPDHIAVHDRTTSVVTLAGEVAPALFYVTTPPGAMRTLVDHVASTSRSHRDGFTVPSTILGVDDPDAWGSAGLNPTLIVDAHAFGSKKLAALACHQSQFHNSVLELLDEADAPRLLGTEHYRRAPVGHHGPVFIEHLHKIE